MLPGRPPPSNVLLTPNVLHAVNAEDSFVPVRFSTFHVELKMLETNVLVAQGPRTGLGPVKGKKKTVYAVSRRCAMILRFILTPLSPVDPPQVGWILWQLDRPDLCAPSLAQLTSNLPALTPSRSPRTVAAIASACAHKYDTVVRDTLNLTMTVQESVVGRIGDYTTSRVVVRDVECPVQFSSSAN